MIQDFRIENQAQQRSMLSTANFPGLQLGINNENSIPGPIFSNVNQPSHGVYDNAAQNLNYQQNNQMLIPQTKTSAQLQALIPSIIQLTEDMIQAPKINKTNRDQQNAHVTVTSSSLPKTYKTIKNFDKSKSSTAIVSLHNVIYNNNENTGLKISKISNDNSGPQQYLPGDQVQYQGENTQKPAQQMPIIENAIPNIIITAPPEINTNGIYNVSNLANTIDFNDYRPHNPNFNFVQSLKISNASMMSEFKIPSLVKYPPDNVISSASFTSMPSIPSNIPPNLLFGSAQLSNNPGNILQQPIVQNIPQLTQVIQTQTNTQPQKTGVQHPQMPQVPQVQYSRVNVQQQINVPQQQINVPQQLNGQYQLNVQQQGQVGHPNVGLYGYPPTNNTTHSMFNYSMPNLSERPALVNGNQNMGVYTSGNNLRNPFDPQYK